MPNQKAKCQITGCSKPATSANKTLCTACYSWMYYWTRRSVSDKMSRLNTVNFWKKRMESIWLNGKQN